MDTRQVLLAGFAFVVLPVVAFLVARSFMFGASGRVLNRWVTRWPVVAVVVLLVGGGVIYYAAGG
jgi:hypothetical protein